MVGKANKYAIEHTKRYWEQVHQREAKTMVKEVLVREDSTLEGGERKKGGKREKGAAIKIRVEC